MIAVTQPRRVAATSLAARVAAEQNVTVGTLVGYSVRFDEACQAQTKIKYVSDGMLVRELLSDPILSRYSIIILDEAHERTLRTDFLIANLKTILAKRNEVEDKKGKGKGPLSESNPLKIVIMSATLDAEKFSRFYNKFVLSFQNFADQLINDQRSNIVRQGSSTSRPDFPCRHWSDGLYRFRTTDFLSDPC